MELLEQLNNEIKLALGEEKEDDKLNVSFAKDISDENIERIIQKRKWTKQRWLEPEQGEMNAINSKIRQSEFEQIDEHCLIVRSSTHWYSIEVIGAESDSPDYHILTRELL